MEDKSYKLQKKDFIPLYGIFNYYNRGEKSKRKESFWRGSVALPLYNTAVVILAGEIIKGLERLF